MQSCVQIEFPLHGLDSCLCPKASGILTWPWRNFLTRFMQWPHAHFSAMSMRVCILDYYLFKVCIFAITCSFGVVHLFQVFPSRTKLASFFLSELTQTSQHCTILSFISLPCLWPEGHFYYISTIATHKISKKRKKRRKSNTYTILIKKKCLANSSAH